MSANEPMARQAETERLKAFEYVKLCRAKVEEAIGEQKRAENLWHRAEQKCKKVAKEAIHGE